MKLKRLLAFVLTLILVVTCIPLSLSAADNCTAETALKISLPKSGTVKWNGVEDENFDAWFEFTLTESGIVNISCSKIYDSDGNKKVAYFYLYDSTNITDSFWHDYGASFDDAKKYTYNIPLGKGTYRFQIYTSGLAALDEDFKLDYSFKFTPATGYETEPNEQKPNQIKLNKKINAYRDSSDDSFEITLSKDTVVRLKVGNFSELTDISTISVTRQVIFRSYLDPRDFISANGYSYFDIMLREGKNVITISKCSSKLIKYWLLLDTNVSYKAPVINSVEVKKDPVFGYERAYVSWTESPNVTYYEFYYNEENSGWKLFENAFQTSTSLVFMGYDKNKAYKFKVRAYKRLSVDELVYSEFSPTVTLYPTPKNVKLSATSYTYNGKVRKPTVTVKGVKGKLLKSGTDYTVSYSSGLKSVGTYKATVKFKGNYSGKVTKIFKIVPCGTTVSSVTAGSKKMTVKWKKQRTQTTGYQVQVSTSSKFKSGNKTVTIEKNSTTSATVSKLKANKKYYLRIRTYKTVKGVKYYSAWSKAVAKNTK